MADQRLITTQEIETLREQVDDITHGVSMDIIRMYVNDSNLSARELEIETFIKVKTGVNEISAIMLNFAKNRRRQQREKAI